MTRHERFSYTETRNECLVWLEGRRARGLRLSFSETIFDPIFFEFIHRKGDDGFGEGSFKALFGSIKIDRINRGVIAAD